MANLDKPMGSFAVKHLHGGRILATFGQANAKVYIGDWVEQEADGYMRVGVADTDLTGVALNYASADAQELYSYVDPSIIFMCQTSGTVSQVDQGSTADILATTGIAVTLRSAHEVSATAQTGSGQLMLVDKVDTPDNAWGANVNLLYWIFEHTYHATAVTEGGV